MTDLVTGPRPDTGLEGPADLMALLGRIEGKVPVDAWRVDGIDLWPLVRIRLAHRLARELDRRPARRIDVGLGAVAARAAGTVRGLVGSARTGGSRRHDPRPPAPAALVCSDGISFVPTPGGARDRHADPLRSRLATQGIDSTLLVPGWTAPTGLPEPTRRLQPALDRALATARLRRPCTPALPGRADVGALLDEIGMAHHLPDERTIAYAAAAVDAMADVFERRIDPTHTRIGLVVEWYALHGMAFVLAGHRRGLPVIDLQHGVQGPLHYAYADWRRLPATGSTLLPDRFWVWDEDAAATIAAWSPRGRDGAIVGGHLEQREWLEGSAPGSPAALRQVDDLLAAHHATALVLVAAGGEESEVDVDAILDVARSGPAGWLWGIRCHPADPDPERWVARAAVRGLTNVEVHLSTALPLFALLARAAAVVTRHSSVALDGLAFGVRSVLTGPQGRELFAAEIDRGTAVMAGPTPADVIAAVRSILGPGPAPVSPPDTNAALDDLIGSVR